VDCGPGCINHGQPPIARYQYDFDKHKLVVGGKLLGRGIIALPQKLGGGVSLFDMETGRTLASIWYSNYGDYGAIPHRIISFPSEDPYKVRNGWRAMVVGAGCLGDHQLEVECAFGVATTATTGG
jgi:hypothetical protein